VILAVILSAMLSHPPLDLDPVGACCFEDYCELLNEQSCAENGGAWAGEFTECSACARVVPVELVSFTVE